MEFVEYFYSLVKQIPKGKVSTYGELAKALGDIRASRAVGRMLNANPYAPIVPCHRVVMRDGSLGGFGAGIHEKIKRLKKEGVFASNNLIENFQNILFTDFKSDFPLKKMRDEQNRLKELVKIEDDFKGIESVAGVDVAYNDTALGACAVFGYDSMKILNSKTVKKEVEVPYIPTYLAFRELPIIEDLIKKMKVKPSVLLVDGNGVLHPYGMGIASHVGVKLDIPTIGVAKTLLCGELMGEVEEVGDFTQVLYEGRLVGYAYKSSPRTNKPIYISPGHKVSFETALEVVSRFCKYKLPEPIRKAHALATSARNAARN
ncbi:MAG: endonuclease V [Methanomassiliicoccales archaeon]|nr:MAG: endonuclease V [Methanomassiliicoccales archaeon]